MGPQDLTTALAARLPEGASARLDRLGDAVVDTPPGRLAEVAALVREPPFGFRVLLDTTAVDERGAGRGFRLVHHLLSIESNLRLRVNASLSAEDPSAPTLSALWPNADWLEREAFDMFGIRFAGHPDLRRILMYDGFEGYPLRKDYPMRRRQPRRMAEDRSAERLVKGARAETLLLNMGPSHPSMHGIIRVLLELDAETVVDSDLEIGYLHRAFEKTCENRTYFTLLPYTDRLNYVSPILNNTAYAMTVERLMGVDVPERARLIRVLLGELSRVADHLTCLGAMAMETGAFTVFLYMMKAREFIYDILEFTTGARLTVSFVRVGGVKADLPADFRAATATAVDETRRVLADVHALLDRNPIFLQRTRGIGALGRDEALAWGWTGPALRATGLAYDLRKTRPDLGYDRWSFDVPTGERGDAYDRYMVRMLEMDQSLRIVEQAAAAIEPPRPSAGPVTALDPADAVALSRKARRPEPVRLSPTLEGAERDRRPEIMDVRPGVSMPAKEDAYTSMEGLIDHFLFFMPGRGLRPPAGDTYMSIEAPNGELGFYLVSDGTDRPARLRVRAPGFHLLSAMRRLIRGRFVADIIPIFGSLNIIGGELER